jgi:MFS family permease
MWWGLLQVATGPLSDRWGRKGVTARGLIVQASWIWLTVLVPSYPAGILGAVLQGAGAAMVYPTWLAAIVDHAHPRGAPRASGSNGSGWAWAMRWGRSSPA